MQKKPIPATSYTIVKSKDNIYGKIKMTDDQKKSFDNEKHSSEYETIAKFVINSV